MYKIVTSNKFEKDLILCHRRGLSLEIAEKAVELLSKVGKLPSGYKPHKLSGTYSGYWECHLQNDWLLIWQVDEKEKIIALVRTGTHSDLF